MMALRTSFIGALLAIGSSITTHAAPLYSVVNLGVLGGADSIASAINESGQVVGESTFGDGPGFHAFLYDGGVMHDLGTLGGGISAAYGINDAGHITGSANTANNENHAFLYDGVSMQDLGTLGGTFSYGTALNNSGVVTGTATIGGIYGEAFLYNGSMQQIPGTAAGPYGSTGRAINESGHVVGEMSVGLDFRPFLYDGTTVHDLGTLGGGGAAFAINESGWVVGASSTGGPLNEHAFLYDGTTMQDLGTLGGVRSSGSAINDLGHVVGNSETAAGAFHAYVYTAGSGMVDLNSLIDPLAGWTLEGANGINNAGQIVGYGTIGGERRAFLLNPVPEPAAALCAIIGLTALSVGRRKMQSR